MRSDVPNSVLEMLMIPGLRPEKVLKLHKELGIDTIDELEAAAKQDRLKSVKGLGSALQRKILAGLEARQSSLEGRQHPSRGRPVIDRQSKFGKFKPRLESDYGRGRPSSRLRARLRVGPRGREEGFRNVSAQIW